MDERAKSLLDVDIESIAQKGKRKNKRIVKVITVSALMIAVALMGYYYLSMQQKAYREATEQLLNGEYEEARRSFEELEGYKDSAEIATGIPYYQATICLNNGDYDTAARLFTTLGDYRDSKILLEDIPYRKATVLLENNAFDEATEAFAALGDYKDSKEIVVDIPYRKATLQLEEGLFDDALEAFSALGEYKDSQDKVIETKYQQASKLLNDKEYDSAYKLFVEVGSYKDSLEKAEEAQAAIKRRDEDSKKKASSPTLEQLATIWNGEYNQPPDITYSKIVWDVDVYRGNAIKYETARTNGGVVTKSYVITSKTKSKIDLTYKAQDYYGNTIYELFTLYIENGEFYVKETNYSGWHGLLTKET